MLVREYQKGRLKLSMFIEKQYECLMGELIHNTFYVNLTNRGKISGIRQFSEVLIRKILNIGSERKLMLGKLSSPAFSKKRVNHYREQKRN